MKNLNRIKKAAAVLVALSLGILAACGGDKKSTSEKGGELSATGEAEVSANGAEVLVFAATGFDTKGFNPINTSTILDKFVLTAIYDSLVRIADQGGYEGEIAESWEESEDHLTYTFHLRDNAFFQNGDPVTAEDIAFSVEQYQSEKATRGTYVESIESVDIIDEHTTDIHLKRVDPFIIDSLSSMDILPKKYFESVGEDGFEAAPVGSGVYQITDIREGSSITLTATDNYWGGKPDYTTIEILNIPDASTRLSMLKTGQADIVQLDNNNLAEIEGAQGVSIKNLTRTTMTNFFVQGTEQDTGEASQNLQVRQALDYAINRQEICDDFYNGYATPEKYWKISEQGEYWEESWEATPYDPDKAIALLKEAGYPDAFEKPTIRVYAPSGDYRAKVAELVVSYWQAVGLDVRLNLMDETSLGAQNWSDEGDAVGSVVLWSSPVFATDGINMQKIWFQTTGRCSIVHDRPQFDEWFAQGLTEPDLKKRNEIDQKILEESHDNLKLVSGIAYVDQLWGVSGKVGLWQGDKGHNLGGFSGEYFRTIQKP